MWDPTYSTFWKDLECQIGKFWESFILIRELATYKPDSESKTLKEEDRESQ